MAIFKYYVDNVSGATGNGGTGPDDAFYTIQQAMDGVSADISARNNIAFVYVKNTGVTYSDENITNVPTAIINLIGTNESFVDDSTRINWENSTSAFFDDYGVGTGTPLFKIKNFNFHTNTSYGHRLVSLSQSHFQNCHFYGDGTNNFIRSVDGGSRHAATLTNCYVQDFVQFHYPSSGRNGLGLCSYTHFKNAMPRERNSGTDLLIMVNCIIEDQEVEFTYYDNYAFINCLFKNSRLELSDRTGMTDGKMGPFVINCSFVDSPTYAIYDIDLEDDRLHIFDNNHFHGSVSGNFFFSNNFDINDYPEAIAATADPIFRDESGGGTYGYVPTTGSILYGNGIWGGDIGPLKGVFSTNDSGTFALGTGGAGDEVTVSGRIYQKVSDTPIVWRVR